ncbi:MAG: type IV pilus biogenesis/stability protein PilW [Pseudomonadota bacterium]|nr:type IV pilus biogenesis/stability protein PilW [Pseudomonadota bacterium]
MSTQKTEVSEATRSRADTYVQLGIEYAKQGDYNTAVAKLQKALEIEPDFANAHHVIAMVYNRIGDKPQAEQYFKRALELDPKDPQTLNDYGLFLCAGGKHQAADDLFARAVANPLYATPEIARANAGVCAARAQNYPQAEKYLRAALADNPRLPTALLEMADISFRLNRYLPARGYLQRYLESAPHTARSLWLGIRIERQLGDRDAAASYALALRSKYPDSEEARLFLETEGRR